MKVKKSQQKGKTKAVAAVYAKPGCLMLSRGDGCRLHLLLPQRQYLGGGIEGSEERRDYRRKSREATRIVGQESGKRSVQAKVEGRGMLRSSAAQEASRAQHGVAQMPPMPMTDQEMQWQRAWSGIVLRHARNEWDWRARARRRLG